MWNHLVNPKIGKSSNTVHYLFKKRLVAPTYTREFMQDIFEPRNNLWRCYYDNFHIYGRRQSGSEGFCAQEYLAGEQWCQDRTLV